MNFVKTFLFTITVPASVVLYFPYWMQRGRETSLPNEIVDMRLVGLIPIAIGLSFYLICAWDFALSGKGTPAPIDPPKMLLANRLYHRMRNPMYVGILLILLGEILLSPSPATIGYFAMVVCVFQCFVIFYEEPMLRKKFGTSYEEYCKTVPRWIPMHWKTKKIHD